MEKEIDLAGIMQFTGADIESLRHLMYNLVAPKIIEIGCWSGYSTVHLASWAKERGGHVWSIDTFDGRGSTLENITDKYKPYTAMLKNLKTFDVEDTVTILAGSSDDRINDVPDDCNMLFIDGDHRYNQVKKDLDNYDPKIKHGIICGHDMDNLKWDEKYINVDTHDNVHHGVTKAVSEKYGKFIWLPRSIWATFK